MIEVIKSELLDAIKQEQFLLHYQPQFNIKNSSCDGVEALLRWQHPTRGLLFPADFLRVAEETGYIVKIGQWVLREACLQNKCWQDKQLPPMRVAVNVSPKQFFQPNFVEMVADVLEETGLSPNYLELELTENLILREDEPVIEQVHRLKHLGVSIALDDFGAGYSSISHLKKIPVDRIKIDQSFIHRIYESKEDLAIVRALITLATGLNIQVIAEGVETLLQVKMLIANDCAELQGFYFSEGVPADQIEVFLRQFAQGGMPPIE